MGKAKSGGSLGIKLVTLVAFATGVFALGLLVGTTFFHAHDSTGKTVKPWAMMTRTKGAASAASVEATTPTRLPPSAPLTPSVAVPRAPAAVAPAAPPAASTLQPTTATKPYQAKPSLRGAQAGPEHYMTFYGDNYVQVDDPVDGPEITIGAWVYLDPKDTQEQIKTIFSNRWSGCAAAAQRNGFALYINAWNTANRQIKVDWGNQVDGCVSLATPDFTVEYGVWTHIAVAFSAVGSGKAMIFKDGQLVVQSAARRTVQTVNGLTIGMHSDHQYGFAGRIANPFALHSIATPEQLQYVVQQQSLAELKQFAVDASSRLMMLLDLTESETHSSPAFTDVTNTGMTGSVHASQRAPIAPTALPEPSPNAPVIVPPPSASPPPVQGGESRWVSHFTKLPASMVTGAVTDKTALAAGTFSDEITAAQMAESDRLGRERAAKVKAAMIHTWGSYEQKAFGADELKPRTGRPQNNWGGMGMTLLDSLDVLWIMGMKDEFKRARDWVASSLSFAKPRSVSFFETTIRALGGLLSAYELSKDRVFLDKAKDLGDRLLPAFNTPSGIPRGQVHLTSGQASNPGWTGASSILAEVGTVQLEFRYLSKHTGDPKYARAAEKAIRVLNEHSPANGLFPIYISPQTGAPANRRITFGALGDSFYEYLVKTWVQGGKSEAMFREMYDRAMDGMTDVLLKRSSPNNLLFVADFDGSRHDLKMDHLVCFVPGMLALGAHNAAGTAGEKNKWRDLKNAKAIAYTCYQMYAKMATGIAPEYVRFQGSNDLEAAAQAPFYILRPEAIESMYILHQITGNPIYREWGWKMFEAIDKYCKLQYGYGAYPDVRQTSRTPDDRMESFWIAETLKYHYMLQSPDHDISLERYTFNTEAHPLGIFT